MVPLNAKSFQNAIGRNWGIALLICTMAPTPQETHAHVHEAMKDDRSGDRVVISGIAGLYPSAHSVKEFADILYSKTNPITKEACRYKFNHPEVAEYAGTVPGLELFDAQFFKVHYRLCLMMDPMSRKIIEQVYHAIFDAGVCPESLSGKKVGVFTGVTNSETEKSFLYKETSATGLSIVGCSKSMLANRISYWLNAKGPSFSLDTASCSSFTALEIACQYVASGECESAIVAAAKLCLHPHGTVNLARVTALSADGKTRSFDENASGCALSEAVNVLFIQKASDALRVYADITHVKCEFNSIVQGDCGPMFGLIRDTENLTNFIKAFYEETNVSSKEVAYVEAVGAGTPESDKAELDAIDKVYCKDRSDPLLVGSVMSNIGYSEAACGITAITKVILGYHTGKLAANMHLENERKDIACLKEGRVQLLKEDQPFHNGYAAVNGMSITGVNAHVLLSNSTKPKDINRYKTNLPYLVTLSGRQESSVKKIIDELTSHPLDPEQIALLHNIHLTKTSSHMGRGYVVLGSKDENTVSLSEQVDYFDDVKRPLWFVYSGMGSQWVGMGRHLMEIPIFAAAIEKCRRVLEPKGVDIVNIITTQDKTIFNNILHSFLGIAAIQIGLTDVLFELGIVPDKIIGHSTGELGCAYADGCITAEEMILSAYYRGLVSLQTEFIRGSMAAVGLGYQQIVNMCPPDIEVACHNSAESCTISGPADSIKAFAAKLTSEGIFIREVPSSNIAYHSRYIAKAGPALLKNLKEVLKNPKLRSERWVSTSVPKSKLNNRDAMYCSAEYHTNNLLSPVLFEEASLEIPSNAVLVEIAPHGLMQAILKRSLPESCVNIPLTLRGNNNLVFLMDAIGKIYMQGFTPKVSALYPKVEFPVSTGTPMLSHMVEWAHGEKWLWPSFVTGDVKKAAACKLVLSIHDDEHSYLQGNIIRGKNLYPFAAVLTDVWDTLSMSMKWPLRTIAVHFQDVRFYAQPVLHEHRELHLSVTLHRVSGRFEVMDDVTRVATGFIISNIDEEPSAFKYKKRVTDEEFDVTSEEFYEMAFNRDYCYRGDFRSIHSATSSLTEARVLWQRNWVTFLDGILQLNALRRTHETVSQPQYIRRICINIMEHYDNKLINVGTDEVMIASVFEDDDCIRCGGVVMENIKYHDLPPLKGDPISLEALKSTTISQEQEGIEMHNGSNGFNGSNGLNDSNGLHGSNGLNESNGFNGYQPNGHTSDSIVQLKSTVFGQLDSLQWVENTKFSAGQGVDVMVYYAGLNHTNIERNIQRNDKELENTFGMDFSGKLKNGQQVMGVVKSGAASSVVRARPDLLWPVPKHWSLEDAATVPLAYCLAYYCLVEKIQLKFGMQVYIENGMSAFGQAVISILLASNCKVFTSVNNLREKRQLLKIFPQLKDDHICGSTGTEFVDTILTKTNGGGCNIVISSPRGELMTDVLKCVSMYGVAIITGYEQECSLGMYYLTDERNIFFLNFSSIFDDLDLMKRIHKLVSEGIALGAVRPASRVTVAPQPRRAAAALRRRAAACVLLHLRETPPAVARLSCSPQNQQLIVCANEALGLLLAEKLVLSGCRRLHIHSQRTLKYAANKLKHWLKQDIKVYTSCEDLTNEVNVRKLLNNCNNRAPVEGIHVIMLEEAKIRSPDDVRLTIQNLDLISRTLCPKLKYFTVLSDDSMGHNTCISRKQHKLPANMINISNLNKINGENTQSSQAFTRWETMNALEEAVLSKHTAVCANKKTTSARSMLSGIAEVANINITGDVEPETTLAELGINVERANIVASYLQDVNNVSLAEQDILSLTVKRLQEIEETLYKSEYRETKGLGTFISYVEPDELLGTVDIRFLQTLSTSSLGKIEIATDEQHIVLVPGIEGSAARLEHVCVRLKMAALVLQPGVDRTDERPDLLAARYVQTLLKNMKMKGHFYLVGFETGVAVALEMVAILEEQGLTGTVFCIGGGPQAISEAVNEVVTSFPSEEAFQDALLQHMVKMLSPSHTNTTALQTAGLPWERKVENCVRLLLGSVSHSAHYARRVIETAYARLQQARSLRITPRALRSMIVVLQPSDRASDVEELQRFSQQPVKVYQLEAPLGDATSDLRCSAIINRHLSPQKLLEFKMKNRCEAYYGTDDSIAMVE